MDEYTMIRSDMMQSCEVLPQCPALTWVLLRFPRYGYTEHGLGLASLCKAVLQRRLERATSLGGKNVGKCGEILIHKMEGGIFCTGT